MTGKLLIMAATDGVNSNIKPHTFVRFFTNYRTLHCGKPGRRTCMFSYEPFTAILEVPEVSPEVVWLLWVVGEALGTTSAPLKAQKPAKTS